MTTLARPQTNGVANAEYRNSRSGRSCTLRDVNQQLMDLVVGPVGHSDLFFIGTSLLE